MAGLFSKVTQFARSPQGRQAISRVGAAAKDPANRRKVEGGLDRVKAGVARRRAGPTPPTPEPPTPTPPAQP